MHRCNFGLIPADPYKVTNCWEEYVPVLFASTTVGWAATSPAGLTRRSPLSSRTCTLVQGPPACHPTIFARVRARSRAGLRPWFVMNAYSFDVDDEGLDASYQVERDTYERIFQRRPALCYRVRDEAVRWLRAGGVPAPPIGEDTFVASQLAPPTPRP